MALTLQSTLTTANYPTDGATTGAILGPSTLGYKLQIIVGNAPCLVSIATIMDKAAGPLAGVQWTNDIPIVAGSGQTVQQSFDGAIGFKAKDLIAGTHATIYAVVWEKGDPIPTDPLAAAGTLSSSGLTPPPTPVSTLNIQHNDTLVATQPTLDFEDATALSWTVVNDAANTRVKVTPVETAPAILTISPADPVGTGNVTQTMMGMGSGFSFTPTRTGLVVFSWSGSMEVGSSGSTGAQMYFGTGAAPANGAGPTGTPLGNPISGNLVAGGRWPHAASVPRALSVGTTYWLDVAINRGGASSCTIFSNTLSAWEL